MKIKVKVRDCLAEMLREMDVKILFKGYNMDLVTGIVLDFKKNAPLNEKFFVELFKYFGELKKSGSPIFSSKAQRPIKFINLHYGRETIEKVISKVFE